MTDKVDDKRLGFMHRTDLDNSDRLRRVLDCLKRGARTTREIIQEADVCAVNTIIAELKAPPNNIPIECHCIRRGVYEYSLPPGRWNQDTKKWEVKKLVQAEMF